MDQQNFIKALEKLQRSACLLISGAFKSTLTAAVDILFGLTPIHLLIKSEARMSNYKFFSKCKS